MKHATVWRKPEHIVVTANMGDTIEMLTFPFATTYDAGQPVHRFRRDACTRQYFDDDAHEWHTVLVTDALFHMWYPKLVKSSGVPVTRLATYTQAYEYMAALVRVATTPDDWQYISAIEEWIHTEAVALGLALVPESAVQP